MILFDQIKPANDLVLHGIITDWADFAGAKGFKDGMARKSNDVDIAVGARIRNLRLRHELSQTSLGDHIGVTFQQVQKYEKGTNRISASRLVQLASLFGVPVAAFYSEVLMEDARPAKRTRTSAGADDADLNRLVKAFQALKDKNLRAAIMRLAEGMAGRR